MNLPQTGELRERVVLRKWVDLPVGMSSVQQTFDAEPAVSLWAKVEPVHSISLRYGSQVADVPTHIIWVRHPACRPEQISTQHVFDWRGRRYRVLGALDANGAQRITRVECKDLGAIRG